MKNSEMRIKSIWGTPRRSPSIPSALNWQGIVSTHRETTTTRPSGQWLVSFTG